MNIDIEKTRKFYEEMDSVWPENDNWHKYSKVTIEKHLSELKFNEEMLVLNAGSGGNDYGFQNEMYHVDITENKIDKFSKFYVASVDNLPFENNFFDIVICVGSVINYTEAFKTLSELTRVLKINGTLVIEFESSWGLEHSNTSCFMKDSSIVTLKYNNQDHKQWLYSPNYIKALLNVNNLRIQKHSKWHYLSGLNYRITKCENDAAKWVKFDKICSKLPLLKHHSNNIMFKCIKL